MGILAVYTTELRTILENGNSISLNDYPIFDENYRSILNTNIIDYYYFREIGFETVAQFNHYLNNKMNIIMPYYNKYYESTLFEFDPLINYQLTETQTREVSAKGETQHTGKTNNLFSDTPQGRIDFTDQSHVTAINEDDSSSTTENNGLTNEFYTRRMEGNIGVQTFSALLNDYRTTFVNVDLMIMDELNDLFIRVY